MNAVIAGRFDSALVIAVTRELAGHLTETPAAGAGIAYCYGNRLEMAKVDFKNPTWPDGLTELKTDLALICLNQPGQDRPLMHRGHTQAWALDILGPVPELPADAPAAGEPAASWTRPSFSNRPEDRFFARLVRCFDPHDPVGSIEACRVEGSAQPQFFFLGPDALVLDAGSEPDLLFGRAQMVRVVSPVRLESVVGAEWEPVAPRNVLALTRFRHSLA